MKVTYHIMKVVNWYLLLVHDIAILFVRRRSHCARHIGLRDGFLVKPTKQSSIMTGVT